MSNNLSTFRELLVPFDDSLKKTKKAGSQGSITYVDWVSYVVRGHAAFPEGYSKTVTPYEVGGQLLARVRITCNATSAYQEALGAAPAEKTSWGGAMAEAESQAFRRAMANWGLGLEMYMSDEDFQNALGVVGMTSDYSDSTSEESPEHSDDTNGPPSDRQTEVLGMLGKALRGSITDPKNKESKELSAWLNEKLDKFNAQPTSNVAGMIIRGMRAKIYEMGLDDPTKDSEK